jgi:integrase/recombinase XerD
MSTNRNNQKKAITISEAYLDFILSRKAKLCSESMLKIYTANLNRFINYLKEQNIINSEDIQAKHVREFLSILAGRKLSDNYISSHARNIKTMIRFFYAEKYIQNLITFDMPKIARKQLEFLNPEQLSIVLNACTNKRDYCLILFMADTGIRRLELTNLLWSDIDIKNGSVIVRSGKGKKFRALGIGIKTRRALLAYSRLLEDHSPNKPVFQISTGKALSPMGLRGIILRLSNKTGIHFTPHALRRSFCTLSAKSGINLIYLQGLMGHSSLEQTRDYVQALSGQEYIQAQHENSPIDKFLK